MIRSDLERLQDARACAMMAIESAADLTRYCAALFNIAIIGEALGYVAAEVRSLAQEMKWAAIKVVRKHIVHGYWQIRPCVILRLAHSDLPALVRMLVELTKRIETSVAKP